MINVINSGVPKIKAKFSPILVSQKESGLSGELEIDCLFFSTTGKDDFGNLSSNFNLYANQNNFPVPPKNGDYFFISSDKYEIIAIILNDNNPYIQPFYNLLLAKKYKMQANIKLRIPKLIFSKLDSKSYDKILSQSVRDISNESENLLAENLSKMVYGDKIGNSHIFTGKLLRGRKSRQLNPFNFDLESNPKIAGADRNYAACVNKGTKKMRARPYFTQTIKQAKGLSSEVLQKNLKKLTNG